MFCKKCGNMINDGAKFCGVCGAEVETVSPIYADSSAGSRKLPVLIISLCAAIVLIGVMITLIVLNPRDKDDEPVSTAKKEEPEKKVEEKKEEKADDSSLIEKVENDYDPAWKGAYFDYIDEYFPEGEAGGTTFKLVFIDDNDIPELFVSGGSMAAGTSVVSYYGGKTEEYYTGEYGANYIERSGLIHVGMGHSGGYSDEIVKLEKGKFTLIASGEYTEWNDGRTEYYWEGEQLTYEEYNAHIAELFDDSKSKRLDLEGSDNYSYEYLYQTINEWPDEDLVDNSGESHTSDSGSLLGFAEGLSYISGMGGFFDVYLDPNGNDEKEDLSDIPFGYIDCFIADYDKDGEDELLVASITEDEHLWFTMYEDNGKVERADQFEFAWPTITCGDNNTHVFCYDHDGKDCIGIFNDAGYGMGVEYCGTLQFTCIKYDGSSFSEQHYYGYVGSDGEVEPEFLNFINGSGINLDWDKLEGDDAIQNIIRATGGSRIFSIILDVNKKFGEGYCTVWYGGSAEFEGCSPYPFATADQKDIDAWKERKRKKEESYYVIPDSDKRLLNDSDLAGLSKEQLRIARNEIPARHGRKFNDKDLQAYFDAKPWYNGLIEADYFGDHWLSEIEKKNMDFIKKHE